jgi:hypothetical protein
MSRSHEHGGAVLVALIVLSALATIASVTVISVQGNTRSESVQRFHGIAIYAAESGAAATMDYLRGRLDASSAFSALVSPNNAAPVSPAGIAGNQKPPGDPGNSFSPDLQAWYAVTILNNRADDGFGAGKDHDSQLHIVVTGYGPDGAMATIEWIVQADADGIAPFALPATRAFTLIGWHQSL